MDDTRSRFKDERPDSWMSTRHVGTAVVVAIGYYLGARLGFALTLAPVPVSTLWPPNAILLSGLLLTERGKWPSILVAVLLAHLAVQFQSGVPMGMVLCWYVSNCAEALMGALLLRRFVGATATFETLRGVAIFLACAIAAPFLSSFLDAGFVKLNGWGAADYWTVWRTRFFSNVLATITLVPAVLTTARALPHSRHLSRRTLVEGTLGVVALTTVCWYIFAERVTGPGAAPALLYSPFRSSSQRPCASVRGA